MKEFIIKEGKHYSKGFNFGFNKNNYLKFEAKFDNSCLYSFNDNDIYDINKLFGYTTMWYHHYQSARIGWRCLDGENIQLLTYSYNAGHRHNGEHDFLGQVKPNEIFTCTIEDKEYAYKYTFEKEGEEPSIFFDNKEPDWFPFKYFLFPYFGGNKTAPHDMKFYINKLE